MITSIVLLAFIFITGLVVGSFLNVVILRTVSGESIVFPGSKCPKCQNSLKWYHNIPLLSYLFLRGKCAYCKEHISFQYPLVEFLTGCVFIGLFLRFCLPFDPLFGLDILIPISAAQVVTYIFTLIFVCLFIVIAGTDFLEMKVADKHTYSLIGIGVLYSIVMAVMNIVAYSKEVGSPDVDLNFFLRCPVLFSIAAAILAFIIMEALRRGTSFLLKVETFGDGDSYIAAGIGAVFGGLLGSFPAFDSFLNLFYALVAMFLFSAIIPVIFVLPLYVKRLVNKKNWYTLGGISAFAIYTIGYWYAQQFGWLENGFALLLSTLVLILLGLLVCSEILKGIKENDSDGMPMPFGPSLLISAFLIIMFAPLGV